ncbi:unnamed protein product [Miscanthus lutarioriparius]|uniref:Uncharacterized protein n=1 Tax=Miscanthus lutarioriparius TaxID=422564 RepID=A0A811S975_9POAL|nr:unnamed protein product [Miscanthus lutarioriparius]
MVLRSMIAGGLALLHLLLVLLSASASASELPPAAAAVRVGVVLDLTSEAGRKSLTCISMALDNFYSAHANSSRRVHLLVGDTRGDVAAAHAGKAGFIFFFFNAKNGRRETRPAWKTDTNPNTAVQKIITHKYT